MLAADLLRLVGLSAIWGASFLFMRVAAPEFGAMALVTIRVAGAALFFVPLFLNTKTRGELRRNAGRLFVVGLLNSAIPFSMFSFAALSLEAGFSSLINATTPLSAALIGWLWLGIPLKRGQLFGLGLGLSGIVILVWGRLSFTSGGTGWAIAAALLATLSYGLALHFTKRYLGGVSSLVSTAGSLFSGSLFLLPLGIAFWPETNPSLGAWASALSLAAFCTALAYIVFFKVIARSGASNAATVTFMVPVFAVLWGAWFLSESLSLRISVGMLVTLLGTAYATGLLNFSNRSPAIVRRLLDR